MNNAGIDRSCMITCPVEGYKQTTVRSAISIKADKVILLDEEKSSLNLLSNFGLNTEVKQISKNDMGAVISSVIQIILDAKKDYDNVLVVLLPSNPVITVGLYVAACLEKVKVQTITSEVQSESLALPVFPFVNISKCEIFVLKIITENGETNKKRLLNAIKKEDNDLFISICNSKEESALRNLHRVLTRLEEIGLLNKRRKSKCFVWSSTSFGNLVLEHNNGHK